MDLNELRELIGLFQESELSEIEIEEGGKRIRLSKGQPQVVAAPPHLLTHMSAPLPVEASPAPAATPTRTTAPTPAPPEPPAEDADEGLVTIDSPMVGVFYASPAPGDPPFINPGDIIEEGHTVCIVEAMKLMNEVTAKFPCTVVSVLVENGEPVEYNQPLFAVRPAE